MTAFQIRRERRGLDIDDIVKMLGISTKTVTRYELGNLHYSMDGALDKLNALNRKWVEEEH